ncbi:MAG: hypothetical protein ABSB52_08995 [Acidimicrobiales bacterium]|jgi:hypothetical protein
MSEEMEDRTFEALAMELSTSEFDSAGAMDFGTDERSETAAVEDSGLNEARKDLLAAIEELGLGSRDPENVGSPAAGCYLSIVPMDRHGHGGVVVGWVFRESGVPGERVPAAEIESVDILNEALGPLLLALGFPIEPYAVDGRWIVTGARRALADTEIIGSPAGLD